MALGAIYKSPGVYSVGGKTVYSKTRPTLGGGGMVKPPAPKPQFKPFAMEEYSKKYVGATQPELDAYNAYKGSVFNRDPRAKTRELQRAYVAARANRMNPTDQTGDQSTGVDLQSPSQSPSQSPGINYFPSWQSFFSPENFQTTYDLGSKQLDRELARAGLFQSGANIEARNDLMRKVFNDERKAAMELAQINADRAERMSQAEALRRQAQEKEYYDRMFGVLDRALSTYNLRDGQSAARDFAGLQKTIGDVMSKLAVASQPRATGGGGISVGPFIPPPASGPNFSQSDLLRWRGNEATGVRNDNTLGTILNQFVNLL
jgi:hypothetical protein